MENKHHPGMKKYTPAVWAMICRLTLRDQTSTTMSN